VAARRGGRGGGRRHAGGGRSDLMIPTGVVGTLRLCTCRSPAIFVKYIWFDLTIKFRDKCKCFPKLSSQLSFWCFSQKKRSYSVLK
jgi:hypothetical protein